MGTMSTPTRSHQTMSLQQAADASPTLARLCDLVARSQRMLATIAPLLPPGLRKAVRSGPVDEDEWCLLVDNTAAAAKLRQLGPAIRLALEHKGMPVRTLRIKVQPAQWR